MSIIDDLKLGADSATVARFEGLARAGRLSAAQIRYSKSLIASNGDANAKAAVVDQIRAEKAAVAERAVEILAAREIANKGLVEGQRVAVTSKKQGRREGSIIWVEDGFAAVAIDGAAVVRVPVENVEAL